MITTTATGKDTEFENAIARTSQSGANDFETGALEDLREFIKNLRARFGKNAIFSVHTNGNLDHGGGLIQLSVNVANYPDGSEEKEAEPAAYDKPELVEEDNLVSKEEQEKHKADIQKVKDAAAKGEVKKDEKGNQVAGVKPAVAEIKH